MKWCRPSIGERGDVVAKCWGSEDVCAAELVTELKCSCMIEPN
ncbi:hypothetical protein HanPSC8_Chr01g0001541 [Helianthus annuus]|nr:hypothetical protein HanPSC8_Chr01g0001541 [Helianthus annuus]